MGVSQNLEDYETTGKPPVIKLTCAFCGQIRDNDNDGNNCHECGSWEVSEVFICEEVKLKSDL